MSEKKKRLVGERCSTNQKDSSCSIPESRIYSAARMRRRARMLESDENHGRLIYPKAGEYSLKKTNDSEMDRHFEKGVLKWSNENQTRNISQPTIANCLSDLIARNSQQNRRSLMSQLSNETLSLRTSSSKNLSMSSVGSIQNTQYVGGGFNDVSAIRANQKIKILATLLPDEILSDPVSRKYRMYNTAVIFPDVSGFTQLCEKYDKTGKGGPSRLTEVLNGYLGSMIQIVLSRNGDVFKFGGDAFLCVWKVPVDTDIRNIVYLAIESAVDIQKNCGEHKTDVGVKLGVKIAVAAGKALFSIIGNESRKHYILVGPPVLDVREAEMLCRSGDVIVAPSAWKYVENYMFYSYTYHSNNSHIKVHDFGPLWKPTNVNNQLDQNNLSDSGGSARPLLKTIPNLKLDDLRPFVLTPVMKSIDLNQSLDYLTEMRQVAIVFFNIAVDFNTLPVEDLVELSHKVFQIVSNSVDKNDGAVNKLTLFDKDMAILVVFGLKGFKHELASQVALKCAYNCVEQLKKLPIISASAGVTTGLAYCGVIGHQMRREYTVMGRPVNMAARLMCAYSNIVSSDRDTFLHSKLESGHFEVLEQKILKGIQNAGPFYKFNLHLKRSKLRLDYFAYPLLGRAKEIHEFENFLNNLVKEDNRINFMVIYGKARIGKTRLVAGLVNLAEKHVFEIEGNSLRKHRDKSHFLEINVMSLTEDDSKSYSAVRLLFQQPLGLSETSSVEEREDKIVSKLGEVREVHILSAFNPIFNVNFDLTPQYLILSQQEQTDAQKNLLKHLYIKCFPKGSKWLIVIEDAEFMDDESWTVLEWCANVSFNVLYLLTIGQRKPLSTTASTTLESFQQKKITLTEIEKWYFSGLACQILGVRAIPVELENLIQNYKNSGNPGWLESFLLTLTQSGSIYIDQTSVLNIKNLKLVSAPEEMLSASRPTEDEKYDSSYWLDCVETLEPQINMSHKTVNVCLLGPNFFDHNKNETDLTMDTMLIRTIDTLKPLEQLVLKAGSVVGNSFKRSALKYLMSKDLVIDERQLGKAVRNLFEIKILACAKGDSSQSSMMIPRRMILVSSIRKEIKCECSSMSIPDDCKDLPKYANCAYMQFRSPIFRDTVYSLLLDDQKKKYHSSSIEYLRKYTTKCKSCQNVPFANLIGCDENDELMLVCNTAPMHGVRSTKMDPKTIFPILSSRRRALMCCWRTAASYSRRVSQNVDMDFGRISLSEGGDCQCSEILCSVYSVLLEHAAGSGRYCCPSHLYVYYPFKHSTKTKQLHTNFVKFSGRKDIMLEIQFEYASLSLTSYNIPLTMQILEEALALVNQMKEDKEYPEFCTPYVFSKIYTLMGATKLCMGRPDNSIEFLELSLKYLKKTLPKNRCKLKFLIKQEECKRKLMTEYLPEKYIGIISDKKASTYDLLSECLVLISIVHMQKTRFLLLCARRNLRYHPHSMQIPHVNYLEWSNTHR
ncbi:hypothetical protein RUM44_011451 [Polyplax serrata]|uniref:Guanylate cyclase domain-containing protein n=1 Tax=Polyplax serrata TaxID=468196 RepID=A0ABR1AQ36_POLSC